jgi:Tol biopolymer transport system component
VSPEMADSIKCDVPAGPEGLPQNPRWSPDGSRLLYEMQRPDGKHDLWVINSDGTNRLNLTKGQGDKTDGAWSPLLHKP